MLCCSAVTSGLLSTVYDTPPTLSRDDPLVMKFDYFHKCQTQAVSPGLVEFFPWMKHLPAAIAPWKRQAEERFDEFSAFFTQLFRDVEKQMVRIVPLVRSSVDEGHLLYIRTKVMTSRDS
jgi:hypothetical protein